MSAIILLLKKYWYWLAAGLLLIVAIVVAIFVGRNNPVTDAVLAFVKKAKGQVAESQEQLDKLNEQTASKEQELQELEKQRMSVEANIDPANIAKLESELKAKAEKLTDAELKDSILTSAGISPIKRGPD